MKKDGVITIFLSLILLLFLNFLLTSIEAARITAGRYYIELLGLNAGKTIESQYYYPLFEQYGILAVDGGNGATRIKLDNIEQAMSEKLQYTEKGSKGGLLTMSESNISSLQVKTLVSDNYKGFKEQIKNEAIYEGADLLCDFLNNDSLESVGSIASLQLKQQEASEATTRVSVEILRLMELVDGICTDVNGLKTDKKGNYMAAASFTKRFCAADSMTLECSYGSSIIYEVVKNHIFYTDGALSGLLATINNYRLSKDGEDRERIKQDVKSLYEALYGIVAGSSKDYLEAIKQAEVLEAVQKIAQSDVLKYEEELRKASGIDSSVLAGFLDELDSLKDYVGLNEKGYNAGNIKKTLIANLNTLQTAALVDYSTYLDEEGEILTEDLERDLGNFRVIVPGLSYDNLIFDYGNLKASDTMKDKLNDSIGKLFSEGVFTLLGLTDVSEKSIDGAALPSKGKESSQSNDIMELFKEMGESITGGNMGSLLKAGYQNLSSDFLAEVYISNHFSNYLDVHNGSSKIDYEREYILFGHKSDSANLTSMAMELIALRAIFCFAALIADGERNLEATTLAQTMAVFGVPALIYVAKYLILTVWAIEEAVIEVAALLAGNKIPVFNLKGNLHIYDLLILTPELVAAKVAAMGNSPSGVGYEAYINILSFIQPDSSKYGRTLDMIQENIRYRYRKNFRIGNCIISGSYIVKGKIGKKFSTGFFKDESYEITTKGAFGF